MFVPMNRYTHGTMMDDYTFLEDVGRRVSEWGKDIVRGGYDAGAGALPPHAGDRQRQRRGGGGGGEMRRGRTKTHGKKRDVLRSQLELRDIDVDLLPPGMERRTLNHSTWDPKYVGLGDAVSVQNTMTFPYCRKRTAFLTIEYRIHPPLALDAGQDEAQGPYTFLTQRNNFDLPLRDLFQSQISQRTKGKTRADLPTWVKTLALPDPDIPDAFTPPQFFIRAPLDPLLSGRSEKFGFIQLDSERRLSALLRNKQFVEFPTIEVWEEGAFRGVLLDGAGALESQGGQRPAKRRRLDVTKGRAAIAGLLGGYGSDASDEADTALARLDEYEGSDAENEQPMTSDEDDTRDLTEESNDEDDEEPNTVVDPAALLAMVQEVQRRHGEDEEYGEVDWGESDKDS